MNKEKQPYDHQQLKKSEIVDARQRWREYLQAEFTGKPMPMGADEKLILVTKRVVFLALKQADELNTDCAICDGKGWFVKPDGMKCGNDDYIDCDCGGREAKQVTPREQAYLDMHRALQRCKLHMDFYNLPDDLRDIINAGYKAGEKWL